MKVTNRHYDANGNIVLTIDDMTDNGQPTTIKIIPRRVYDKENGQICTHECLDFAGQIGKRITECLNNLNELSFWDGPDNSPV